MIHIPGSDPITYDFFVNTPHRKDNKELDFFDIEVENNDQTIGIEIVKEACKAPFTKIMENAGLTSEVIWNKLANDNNSEGYDARHEKVVDMFEAGIIDPVKVTRVALEKAASVAGTMLITECVVSKIKEEKEPVNPLAGMGM